MVSDYWSRLVVGFIVLLTLLNVTDRTDLALTVLACAMFHLWKVGHEDLRSASNSPIIEWHWGGFGGGVHGLIVRPVAVHGFVFLLCFGLAGSIVWQTMTPAGLHSSVVGANDSTESVNGDENETGSTSGGKQNADSNSIDANTLTTSEKPRDADKQKYEMNHNNASDPSGGVATDPTRSADGSADTGLALPTQPSSAARTTAAQESGALLNQSGDIAVQSSSQNSPSPIGARAPTQIPVSIDPATKSATDGATP